MARSPLFRALAHAARHHRQHDPSAARHGWTRRDLLKLLAVPVAASLARPLLAKSKARGDVLVVGGGLAGLTCAWQLQQAGMQVTLLEAQDRAGGRAHTLRTAALSGTVAEAGGELVDRDHRRIQRLVERLNSDRRDDEPELQWDRIRAFEQRHQLKGDLLWAGGQLRDTAAIGRELAKVAAHVRADAAQQPDGSQTTGRWRALDQASAAEYFDGFGQLAERPAPWLAQLLSAAWTAEYGLDARDQSALNFVSGFGDLYDGDEWQWDDDGRECLHLRGGNDQLATRLARRVGERGKVLLGHSLLALEPRDAAGWRATVQRGDQRIALQTDWVVLALPFSRLREADLSKVKLSARKRLAIGTLGYGTNTKVIQAIDGQPWRQWGLAGSLLGNEETGMIWDASRPDQDAPLLSPATGVLTQFRGGQHAVRIAAHRDKGAVEATWQRVVRAWQSGSSACPPDALAALLARRRGDAMFIDWANSPVAKGSYACYRRGQWTAIAGCEGEPEPDAAQLSFCGEHTAVDAPGYLEGAVESGERAAREVLVAAR